MIEVYVNGAVKKVTGIKDIIGFEKEDIIYIKLIGKEEKQLNEIAEKWNINLEPFQNREDIEISSHYIDVSNQLTLNLSIPINISEGTTEEESIHIVIKENILFLFLSENMNKTLNQLINLRYDIENLKLETHLDFLAFQIGILSDYFADIVELNSNKIRDTYYKAMSFTKVSDDILDILTKYNFNNFILRDSVSEFQRVILLLRKKYSINKIINEKLEIEINDLNVVSEHIQYNFERVNDLKTNINSKIELEQNKIFKTLTIITVCVSIPSLIAGIYGMNFKNMPELNYYYSYPIVIVIIILSCLIPLIYFKRNKWF